MEYTLRSPFAQRLHTLPAYDSGASEFRFLLGGIGTGNVSVGSRGQLCDWELFNRPGKGNKFPYSFFAIHTECDGEIRNIMLEGALQPPYSAACGVFSADLGGLPRMQSQTIRAEYPLCLVEFFDQRLPVQVAMESYTPFIPLNSEDSGLPGAVIRYRVRNLSQKPVFVSIAGSMANMTTALGTETFEYPVYYGDSQNQAYEGKGLNGLRMDAVGFPDWHPMKASMALCTTNPEYTVKPNFLTGSWWDGIQDYWDDFCQDGKLDFVSAEGGITDTQILNQDKQHVGGVAAHHTLAAGEEYVFEFLLTWYFPNRKRAWDQNYDPNTITQSETIRNHYGLKFAHACEVAEYMVEEMPRLENATMLFHKAFFESTLPVEILDAASSNITVLRSTTCFWLENGMFMGWEGCHQQEGSCHGNCTHVWNYEQTLAFLFPDLERSMRETEFLWETEEDGNMHFRAQRMLEGTTWEMYPAADGQLGTIVRLWREYKLSGKLDFLQEVGEQALKALDFSITHWDQDGDGVLDSQQHNTYDIEFYGITSMTNSMFYAALRAGNQIACLLGQKERGRKYLELAEKGGALMDQLLWNGEYYEQKIDDLNQYKYQYGKGVLADQLLGQYVAFMAGLGYILPESHVKQALKSIFRYNFKDHFADFSHVQRTYALQDEKGLLLCSWPKGGRPRFPFVYSDEVWSGIEYQVASTMLWAGLPEEALEIVRGVRGRYNGRNRNPFDEVECGYHYARSMASWGLIVAASGFSYQADGEMSFAPKFHSEDFRCFYSNGREWGVVTQKKDSNGQLVQTIEPLYHAHS